MMDSFKPGAEVGRMINLIPVGLKEAALDSPTSRATIVHYGEQVELVEKWLDEYLKFTNRLVTESITFETILNNFITHAGLPPTISETMLDHDYSLLAIKKYSEASKDFWMSTSSMMKRLSYLVVDPIKHFLQAELRSFKEARRTVDVTQKAFDNIQAKYAALGKTKEPSSLREDAFQLHEARKAYLKASMDFYFIAPQFRFALDKLLVRVFFDQWREMSQSRENSAATFQRGTAEMERVKGWVSEMENSEKTFRKELIAARKQLEDAAELDLRPSRELDDYSVSTVPHFSSHSHTPSGSNLNRSPRKSSGKGGQKSGWLYLRTYTGKPIRTIWVKRWAFLRNGVFGWLLQDMRLGGVEESERIGVLLCNVRPAPVEERRFCFELKTNKNTIVLQAETQTELMAWISAIEAAKSKAVEDPGSTDNIATTNQPQHDPAFAISPPPVPEFGTTILASTEPGAGSEEQSSTMDRATTLPVPGNEAAREGSVDLPRRSTAMEDGARDHASRIMSKLDLHRKNTPLSSAAGSPTGPIPAGGIASLIAASHSSMPVGPSIPMINNVDTEPAKPKSNFILALRDMPASTLAPSTLAAVPTPTNLSKSAVVVTGERGLTSTAEKSGIPNVLLANTWGSSDSCRVNRLDRTDFRIAPDLKLQQQASPLMPPRPSPPKAVAALRGDDPIQSSISQLDLSLPPSNIRSRTPSPSKRHRNTISYDKDAANKIRTELSIIEYPSNYPIQLKTQDTQFRLLFSTIRQDERLVMVFRATWNPNDQQEFPGRVYVTAHEIYFYSNHFGLVLTSSVSLTSIDEATAAPGKECDYIFLHLKEPGADGGPTRITIKTFIEPLRLLQRRLNFLIRNSVTDEPMKLEGIIRTLLKMESEAPDKSPSLESWEDVSPYTPVDSGGSRSRPRSSTVASELKAPVRIDRALHRGALGQEDRTSKFKLPAQPVNYTPAGNLQLAVEKVFDVSAKALFHLMFGDKSALWQLLQHERRARNLQQGPWINMGEGRLRRDFAFDIPYSTAVGVDRMIQVHDYQVIDVNSDHLCYVVTDKRTPWDLPFQHRHRLVSKIVITHVAKAKCKLAVFIKVEWLRDPWLLKGPIERQGLADLELDSLDLADIVADQVRKLGVYSRTKKAIQIFGQVGHATETTQLVMSTSATNIEMRRTPRPRTITTLFLQSTATLVQSAAGSALQLMLDLLRWVGKVFSANRIIIAVLLASIFYNTWHTSLDTRSWYHERKAAQFMKRVGVSPNNVMNKAVYVKDLDEILTTDGQLPNRDSSSCYSVFYDEHRLDIFDGTGITSPQSSSSNGKSRLRISDTRQRLGTYRHDLLVAMRVVNSIEKEVVKSEWESWLIQEHQRCRQVAGLIVSDGENKKKSKTSGDNVTLSEDITNWYNDYCDSCQNEYAKVRK